MVSASGRLCRQSWISAVSWTLDSAFSFTYFLPFLVLNGACLTVRKRLYISFSSETIVLQQFCIWVLFLVFLVTLLDICDTFCHFWNSHSEKWVFFSVPSYETAVGTMPSWCVSGGRSWMARGCADSEQLVSVSPCECVCGGGLKYSSFYTGFPGFIQRSFSKCWPTVGWLSWFHLSSCDNGHSFPSLRSLRDCKLPIFSSSCPLSVFIAQPLRSAFQSTSGSLNWREAERNHLRSCTWQPSTLRARMFLEFKTNIDIWEFKIWWTHLIRIIKERLYLGSNVQHRPNDLRSNICVQSLDPNPT